MMLYVTDPPVYEWDVDQENGVLNGYAEFSVDPSRKLHRLTLEAAEDLWLLRYGYVPQPVMSMMESDVDLMLLLALNNNKRLWVYYDLHQATPMASLKGGTPCN